MALQVDDTVFLGNSVLSGNTYGLDGATITAEGVSIQATIRNTTIVGNRGRDGGGIALENLESSVVDVSNTIVWGNQGSAPGRDVHVSSWFPSPDPADTVLSPKKDGHLTAASPCIDAGTCAGASPTDFDGDPRPTGAGCDIGADEFVS